MRILITLVIALISIAYPVIIFFGTKALAPAVFSLLLLGLALFRFVASPNKSSVSAIATLVVGLAFSALLALSNSAFLLRLYPVAMSWIFATLFALSLREEESLIEQFARVAGKQISTNAKRYTRRLSALWAIVLLINGAVALYLAIFASLASWALYCGLLSYLVLGALFVGELLYRPLYIRKYGA